MFYLFLFCSLPSAANLKVKEAPLIPLSEFKQLERQVSNNQIYLMILVKEKRGREF